MMWKCEEVKRYKNTQLKSISHLKSFQELAQEMAEVYFYMAESGTESAAKKTVMMPNKKAPNLAQTAPLLIAVDGD